MKQFESIIEKQDSNLMSYKPKPLCSCFIGDKMVDMYARFNFDMKCVGWSRAYKGHTHSDKLGKFIDNVEVYDGTDEKVNNTIDAIQKYFYYHQLYLH